MTLRAYGPRLIRAVALLLGGRASLRTPGRPELSVAAGVLAKREKLRTFSRDRCSRSVDYIRIIRLARQEGEKTRGGLLTASQKKEEGQHPESLAAIASVVPVRAWFRVFSPTGKASLEVRHPPSC